MSLGTTLSESSLRHRPWAGQEGCLLRNGVVLGVDARLWGQSRGPPKGHPLMTSGNDRHKGQTLGERPGLVAYGVAVGAA
jgi:hypothetical protein